jgi:hypothetical protein
VREKRVIRDRKDGIANALIDGNEFCRVLVSSAPCIFRLRRLCCEHPDGFFFLLRGRHSVRM